MEVHVYCSTDDMMQKLAMQVAKHIKDNPGKLICFAAGDTPIGMLHELVKLQKAGVCDLNTMYFVGLDEWLGLGYKDRGSCAQVMMDNFYIPADINVERMCIFNGHTTDIDDECNRMNDWIFKHGGIFLSVLGIGLNGHIGFNEPYAPDREGCFLVRLDSVTKEVSKKYFTTPTNVSSGITIGWRTLLTSKNLFVLASGKHKAEIVKKAFVEEPSISIPASLLRYNTKLKVVLDKDAADEISKVLNCVYH